MRLKSLIIIGILILFYAVYYWCIPAVINSRTDAFENILRKHGYHVKVVNPEFKTGFRPEIILKADDFILLNEDNSKAIEIERPYIKIALLPLILKKIDIRDFSADNFSAKIFYDKTLKLGQYLLELNGKFPLKLKHAKLKLGGYNIEIQDLTNSKSLLLKGKYLDVAGFSPGKELIFLTAADFYTGDKPAQINFDVETRLPFNKISQDNLKINADIINLNIDDFTPCAKILSKDEITKLTGIINVSVKTDLTSDNIKKLQTRMEFNDFGIYTKEKSKSVYAKDKLTIFSSLHILKDGFNIDYANVSGNGINFDLLGSIKNLTAKFPNLDINLKIKNSLCESIIPLLPGEENLVPEINLLKLKQTVFGGNVNGNLKIKGKAGSPNIFGKIDITDAYLVKPISNAQKAVILLDFRGEKILLDTHVPTDKNQYVDVTGPIEIYPPRNVDLRITSTDKIDFVTAQTVLNPLHEILTFQLGPVPIMKLSGTGNINLHITGNKEIPHGWGKFTFQNTTAEFNDIHNLVLKDGFGELTFNDEDTYFIAHKSYLNGRPVKIEGTCTLQGEMDFKITANNQNINQLITIIRSSPMLEDIRKMILPIENANGISNINLNITGKVKDPNDIVFNKNIFVKGIIELFSNEITLKDLPVKLNNVNGKTEFENEKITLNLLAAVKNSKIKITGEIKDDIANLKTVSEHFALRDVFDLLPDIKIPYGDDFSKVYLSFTAKYSGKINPVNYNNIFINGKIHPSKGSEFNIDECNFELNNSAFKTSQISGTIENSPYKFSINVNNAFNKKPNVNGDFKLENFNLANLNNKNIKDVLRTQSVNLTDIFSDFEGYADVSAKINNGNGRIFALFNDISFIHIPSSERFQIKSGNLFLNNNTLHINKINAQSGGMPIWVDGKINKIFDKKPEFNLYINAKLNREFFDRFFNNRAVYPIKLKGEMVLSSIITGRIDNLKTKSVIKLDENSDLYYMGVSTGDKQHAVNIEIDSNITPAGITLNRFQYNKISSSDDNKPLINSQVTVNGAVTYLPDNNAAFKNLHITTQSPTDAKIFNIIFKKPLMKQGTFTSDLMLNGTMQNPEIRGKLDIAGIDMPFFDSTIKDINLEFKPDTILIKSRGAVFTNNIELEAAAKNKLTPPYIIENVKVKLEDLDINKLTAALRDLEAEATRNKLSTALDDGVNFDIDRIILKNADVTANTISVRNIRAEDLTANLNFNEKMRLNIDKFRFKTAEGTVEGNFHHNFLTHAMQLHLNLDRANAQIMTEALFDLKGQIYGSMTGETDISCNGSSYEECMRTLEGEGSFTVSDGKMPKLGSLEYLLKAGNLIKSGLTGLSINGIIDFITPLKTGEFSSIKGDIKISEGIISPINIYSNGNDLNMYLTGSYNIVTAIADMKIFGSLSKNVTNVFGRIKNASLNTLLNTIPGINEDERDNFKAETDKIPKSENGSISRLFNAEIYGDINGENYVKSFHWIR